MAFNRPVAKDVLDLHSTGRQGPGNEQEAMAVQWIVLGTDQSYLATICCR